MLQELIKLPQAGKLFQIEQTEWQWKCFEICSFWHTAQVLKKKLFRIRSIVYKILQTEFKLNVEMKLKNML